MEGDVEDTIELDMSSSDADSEDFDTSSKPEGEAEEEDYDDSGEMESAGKNRIVDLSCLQSLLLIACVCSSCQTGQLKLRETRRHGLASVIQLICGNCGQVFYGSLSNKHPPHRYFSVNRQSAVAMSMIGRAREGLRKFCAVMDLPEPVRK